MEKFLNTTVREFPGLESTNHPWFLNLMAHEYVHIFPVNVVCEKRTRNWSVSENYASVCPIYHVKNLSLLCTLFRMNASLIATQML